MYVDTLMGGAPSMSRPRGLTAIHDEAAVRRAAEECVAQYGGRFVGRHAVRDMLTFDAARQYDAKGNMLGKPLGFTGSRTYQVTDSAGGAVMDSRTGRPLQKTFTFDSTGAYLVGELERLDPTFHGPLVAVSWMRDIDLREDVTTADDASSFTLSTFGAAPGAGGPSGTGTGVSWAGRSSTQVTSVSLDISKKVYPLIPWAMELAYTVFELESAAKLGRPVDEQKFKAIQTKHQMDIDQLVYVGDAQTQGTGSGLINNVLMTNVNNLPNGVSGFSQWVNKTPTEILADINGALTSVWATAAWAVTPRRMLIPPNQFGYISTQLISLAGSMSILRYVDENNLLTGTGQGQLEILPMKWLIGAGVGGTLGVTGTVDRMFVYTKNKDFVRYPMTTIQRTPVQYDGLYHKATYYCKLGQVEEVYPETVGAFDGL